jgi:hypothetical protein
VRLAYVAIGFLGAGFITLYIGLLGGCASMMGPTDPQLTACAKLIDTQLTTGLITKAQAVAYEAQIKGSPAVLPQPCIGHV